VTDAPKNIHLLGICGTAMAALAGSLQAMGYRVTGTDEHVYPPMNDHLRKLGIAFSEGYRPENIPADTELVVVGNVISAPNPEAAEMRRRGLPYVSMAEAVQRFTIRGRYTVAVVGTHGKTTTTSLMAHVLVELGADPGFLIGGIARNFGSNFRVGSGERFVIEGDEYDTAYFDKTPKFFKYKPTGLIFTSLEFDHADIYADLDAIRVQFAKLLAGLPPDGLVVACADQPHVVELLNRASAPVVTYGFDAAADCRLDEWAADGTGARFTTRWRGMAHQWNLPLPGKHNALNATAVLVMAQHLGYSPDRIQSAFSTFLGVKRRQEVRGEADGVTVLDDFAHHPTAVRETLAAVRAMYPGRRLWAVFEPRSFTARSPRFQAEWPGAFTGADRVAIAPAFRSANSAETLDTAALAAEIRALGTRAESAASNDALLATLIAEARPGDVMLMMSNGGFDNLHDRLLAALRNR
jgi:UDP-N-acetylmuramate: L-alanyl-gamma-D-glutamyl-meso-diaminopimelate ligase